MIQPAFEILNQRGTPMFFSDVFANRPTAGIIGRIFISTDTKEFYRDTGTTWELIGGPGTGTITGSGVAGQVSFWDSTSTITGSNNLWWDNVTNKFLVGTNNTAGVGTLQVTSATGDNHLRIWGASSPSIRIDNAVSAATQRFVMGLSTATNNFIQGSAAGDICISTASANPLLFGMWQTINASEVMRISTANNLLIGSSVDTGQRVQITGTTQITPASNATALSISGYSVTGSNSNNGINILGTWNTTGTPSAIFMDITDIAANSNSRLIEVRKSGTTSFYHDYFGTTGSYSFIAFPVASSSAYRHTRSITQSGDSLSINSVPNVLTSGTIAVIGITNNIAPTSGTAVHNTISLSGTINQTGGANGITRGLYINPTLTAAAEWRSIDWSNNSGFGLYGSGSAFNFLNGSLGIGTTQLTNVNLRISKNIDGGVAAYSFFTDSLIRNNVTSEAAAYAANPSIQSVAFTLSNLRHFQAVGINNTGLATITNQYGFSVQSNLTGATNNFGFHSDIAAGSNRWNFYANGTANNFFNGSIGLASTNLTGFSLRVSKSLTGASTTYGIFSEGTILSDVTSATYISTFASVLNTAFTVANLRHFIATGSTTFGAATVSAQSGFTADNALTGATNNYGFRGLISSGTGRWNLFMDGAGANHMAGNLLLGSTTNPGQLLYVSGSIRVDGQRSATAGGASGQHLIINCDGIDYKIALLNP